jgi:hypothetical protein
MILLLFGIYAMVTARLRISRRYGLKGEGARVAGVACAFLSLTFFTVFEGPITSLAHAFGLAGDDAALVAFPLQIVALVLILVGLVRAYGNAYENEPAPVPMKSVPAKRALWWGGLVALTSYWLEAVKGDISGYRLALAIPVPLVAPAICFWWYSRSKSRQRRTFIPRLLGYLLFGLGTEGVALVGVRLCATGVDSMNVKLACASLAMIAGSYFLVFAGSVPNTQQGAA